MAAGKALGPTVEVVMCTYNGARFLDAQLESILSQTRRVDRVSIWDDASTDDTVERARAWVGRLGEETVIEVHVNDTNLGYAGNFERAIAAARGDVLFLCDQDDVWEMRKVERLLALLEDEGVDMALSDGVLIDANGAPIPGPSVLHRLGLQGREADRFRRDPLPMLARYNRVNGAACAIRRRAAQAALPLPAAMPHDQWLALACAAGGRLAVTSEPLYRYRQHATNAIGAGGGPWLYHWLGILRQPRRPRERELSIWRGVHARLSSATSPGVQRLLDAKLSFLSDVVETPSRTRRALRIFVHLLRGSYWRYAPPTALRRDLIGLFRTGREPARMHG